MGSSQQPQAPHKQPHYGADITKAQLAKLAFALCMGTLVEWFDFSVHSQLANTITQLFFPSTNPTVSSLSFWAVYAAGFVTRPADALLFGHVGDAHGRRVSLLWSVLGVTLPTLLIGCLPTYAMIGVAAPALMAVLRAVQGVAVGGEYGTAITYLYEVAPMGHKGLMASLGQLAVAPGTALGIIVCQAVLYGCTQEQLLVWGWRVPFLLTVFASPLALLLRMHMPEPLEFVQDREHETLQRVASTAASRTARAFSRQLPACRAGSNEHAPDQACVLSPRLSMRELSQRLQHCVSITREPANASCAVVTVVPDVAAAAAACKDVDAALPPPPPPQQQQRQPDSATAQGTQASSAPELRQRSSLALQRAAAAPGAQHELPAGCQQVFQQELTDASLVVKHHLPLVLLFDHHWRGVLLQFLTEAAYGCIFYTSFSWLPAYVDRGAHDMKTRTSVWGVLAGLELYTAVVPLTGRYVNDTRVPKVRAYLAAIALVAVAIMPVMLVIETGHAVGVWLLLPLLLALCGVFAGCMTTIGPQIYPPAVRATGYNFSHNLAQSLFGGVTPLTISALSVAVKPPSYAAAVVVISTALLSLAAGVALARVAPATNAPCPAGGYAEYVAAKERARQLQQVVVAAADAARPGDHDVRQ